MQTISALPTGVVAFLLTDVEGSTRLWAADPDSMHHAIVRHYELLDTAIRAAGGVRPVEQGEGDSIVAAFERPTDALSAALAAQQALQAEEWPTATPFRVRMALHLGEARLRDEGNYAGETLNRAARLRALAHGGQVLASQAFADVAALPTSASFLALGHHRLKDLDRPESVVQLCHPDLPADFAPLRTGTSLARTLPSEPTALIGRDREIDELIDLARINRLVTLVGTGGVGKTRLALRLAHRLRQHDLGDVAWVELAQVLAADSVPGAVLQAVGGIEVAGRDSIAQFAAQIGSVATVVVLDNCEHVLDACAAWVDHALAACPSLTVLATSREALSVRGEITWRAPSLPHDQAVELFLAMATRARPNLALDAGERSTVDELCQQLDGVPLAIELAAARCRSMSPSRILQSLGDRFRLLTGGARTGQARQQTLLASVEWSYQLLDDREQAAWRRLSVFTGPFDLDAAEAVLASDGIDRYDVLDLLDRLVDKSLVVTDDGRRYRLLETIRQFGLDRLLATPGEAAATRDAHCAHCAHYDKWVAQFGEYPLADDLPALSEAYPNLMSALGWACEANHSHIVGVTRGCTWVWFFEHRYDDYRAVGRGRVLPTLREVDHDGYLDALATMVEVEYTADPPAARVNVGAMLAEAVSADHTLGMALGSMWLGSSTADVELLQRAEHLAVAAGSSICQRAAILQTANAYARRGQISQAIEAFERIGEHRIDGGMAPLGVATGRVTIASEAGEIDAGVDAATSALEEQWVLGFREPLMRAMVGWSAFLATIMAQRDDAFDYLVDVARWCVSVSPIGSHFLLCMRVFEPMMHGSQPAEADLVAMLDELALRNHRRVDYSWALTMLGRYDLARRCLDRSDVDVTWPKTLISSALIEGLDILDPSTLHDGLTIAIEHGARRSTVDLLEALALVHHAGGAHDLAARLAGACATERDHLAAYRYRGAHLAPLDELTGSSPWNEGVTLTLEAAVEYAQRGRGERLRPSYGWASLTPTERRVAEAAAEGLTNPQIGERLFISLPTVKSHLSHIFRKVGINSRAELIRAAEGRRRF